MATEPRLHYSEDVVHGMNRVAADVAQTLGPKGKTFDVPGVGESRTGAVVVGLEYDFAKPGETSGADCMRALARGSAGDGASTGVVIANQMVTEGCAVVMAHHFDPAEVARGIGMGVTAATRQLYRHRIPVHAPVKAARAGAISVGADPEVGQLIGEVLARYGTRGTIEFVPGNATRIESRRNFTRIFLQEADGTRLVRARWAYEAAKNILQNGAVLGGGLGLVDACSALARLRGAETESVQAGVKIVQDALVKPAACIVENAKMDFSRVRAQRKLQYGIDLESGELVDYAEHGILDPFLTVSSRLAQAGQVGVSMVASLKEGEGGAYLIQPDIVATALGGAAASPLAAGALPPSGDAHSGGGGSAVPPGGGGSPPDGGGGTPAGGGNGGPPSSTPGKLERFTDVLCTRQVSINTARFPVGVGLTIKAQSGDAQKVLVEPGEVSVSLTSFGVEPIGKTTRKLKVAAGDEEWLTFIFRPVQLGHGYIRVEYLQAGHSLASVRVPIEVVKQEVVEGPGHSTTPVQDVGTAPPADWRLYVTYESHPQHRLRFGLARGDEEPQAFKDVGLKGSPEVRLASLYEKLEALQAGPTDLNDEKLRGQVRNITDEEAEDALETLGNRLWEEFLPDDFRRKYYDNRDAWNGSSLIIYSNEPWIPWELVHPYQPDKDWKSIGPWCETMRLTRWLHTDDQPQNIPGTPPLALRMNALTLVVPKKPKPKLEFAKVERRFMTAFRKKHKLEDGGVDPVTDVAVRKALKQPYDWVHAAAHGDSLGKGSGEAPLLLDTGSIGPDDIYGSEIQKMLSRAPSFVFNACRVGREDWTVFGNSGWATKLVGRGAGLFIAPLWSVTDGLAHEFVRTLYNELADGKTIGEAVHAGRQKAREKGDPTWLAYCVYAHPNAKIVLPPARPQ